MGHDCITPKKMEAAINKYKPANERESKRKTAASSSCTETVTLKESTAHMGTACNGIFSLLLKQTMNYLRNLRLVITNRKPQQRTLCSKLIE